ILNNVYEDYHRVTSIEMEHAIYLSIFQLFSNILFIYLRLSQSILLLSYVGFIVCVLQKFISIDRQLFQLFQLCLLSNSPIVVQLTILILRSFPNLFI
ncbi:unnamed protein product, partial [Rotaria magnacalcarata]